MRTHRRHSALMCWTDERLIRENVTSSDLAAARLEAVLPTGASLDLTFVRGERVLVAPCILISAADLEYRENAPFVWPQPFDVLDPAECDRIEAALLPWIESLTLAQPFWSETIRAYGDARSRALFDAAREAGFLGAAPYERVLTGAAPYAYAARFAREKRVRIRDADGALGAALLHRSAGAVRADLLTAQRNDLAARWYGVPIFGEDVLPCEVAIAADADTDDLRGSGVRIRLDAQDGDASVGVARPLPHEVLMSFDPEDAPIVRRFCVECDLQVPLRPAGVAAVTPAGGSSGRILLLVRDDWQQADDADVDDARALADLLNAEGFRAEIEAASAADVRGCDLVHAFSALAASQLRAPLAAARAAGIPIVLTPGLTDVLSRGAWGTAIVPALVRTALDGSQLAERLRAVEAGRIEAAGISPARHEPYPGYEPAVRELLAMADALVVSGPAEEALVRSFGCSGVLVHASPHLKPVQAQDPVPVAGTSPYALVHAPVEPRNNQYLIVLAAMQAGIPLVIAGPVIDTEYYHHLLRLSDERVAFVPKVTRELAAGLYRSARVYLDLAWMPYGLARAASAGAAGCALVLSSEGYGPGLWPVQNVRRASPGSVGAIVSALQEAWTQKEPAAGAAAIAAWAAPAQALRNTVSAYALAQQARVPG